MDLNDKSLVQEAIKFAGTKTAAPVFKDISADDEDQAPTEIESLCMNCHEQVRFVYELSGAGRVWVTK